MKNSSPKKSFSGPSRSGPRKNLGKPDRKESSSRPFSGSRSSSTSKSSYGERSERPTSYKGRDSRPYSPASSSSVSSSPKSYYGASASKSTDKDRDFRPRGMGRPAERNSDRPTYQNRDTRAPRKDTYTSRVPSSHTSPSVSEKPVAPKPTPDTSWGGVADWYNKHLEKGDDTYHVKVIFPNILRMLDDVAGKKILDMACGQGIFAEQLRAKGAFVTGVDLGKELIALAETKNESIKTKGTHKVTYHVASSDDLFMLKDKSFDIIVCILAIQNIENLQKTISEAERVLIENGKLFLVLNHPSFRNPKQTYWGYNEADDTQYRRVDEYMSESRIKIDMTPGSIKDKKFTVSFHRPLQVYMKALSKCGFAVTRLEEWTSHKESEKGPKQHAENKARKEIPMFMCIEASKGNF